VKHKGATFFDNDETFRIYRQGRYGPDSPNETLEKPILLELLGDVAGKHILDLGCGDGRFGLELLAAGCHAYWGLEASHRMVQVAQSYLQEVNGQVSHARIEDWHYPVEQFDLVISRLALHYVAPLEETCQRVNRTLRRNGQFIFSIVHPVITSCDRSRQHSGRRQDWIVDNYFESGSRSVRFMGELVEQYHRTVEEIFTALQQANFQVEQLRESCPRLENFTDKDLYERRKRIPLFLILSGRKVS
jgi:SAM-dependent methyltransferase